MIAKDCTERLSAVALSIGLIIQRGSCVSGHVDRASFFSDTPPKCLHRDCVGRRRTGTRHGNVYLSVREKQGIVVYQQRVLQTVTSLDVLSLLFRQGQRPPENRKFWSPARSQIFTMETIRSPRERRKCSLGLGHN